MKNTAKPKLFKLAKKMYDCFDRNKRENGDTYYFLKDPQDRWMIDICHDAHDAIMPNDFIYECIVESLCIILECSTYEQAQERGYEIEPDCYNVNLLNWVSQNLYFAEYVDEAMDECQPKGLFEALRLGKYRHRKFIYDVVLNGLEAQAKI